MPVFIDQTGQQISLPFIPLRIISLVPSQTELLFDLGLDKEVTGITKFCVHPAHWFRTKKRVGGTKQLNMDIIHELNPDLVIANKEENEKEQITYLQQHYPVWTSDIHNLEDAYHMIKQISLVTGTQEKAEQLVLNIKKEFDLLKIAANQIITQQSAYLIWKDPYMTIGGDTFISSLMQAAGFNNLYQQLTRYPVLTIPEIQSKKPDLLLLSSEPYPFKQKDIDQLTPYFPATKIILVDGEMFSWYGSRLLKAPGYFLKLWEQIK